MESVFSNARRLIQRQEIQTENLQQEVHEEDWIAIPIVKSTLSYLANDQHRQGRD